ncbi:MAG: beta strand repeat-containing protein [Kiritimatiellia bacterium]
MRKIMMWIGVVLCVAAVASADVWINEIHYDTAVVADENEGVEVAGTAGTDLTGYSIVAYNGSGGAVYDTEVLSGTIDDEGSGFGALWFPIVGLQNGSPDGLALVDASSTVIQFLSYEGVFSAVGGPADGMSSVDIGVVEPASTNDSLQLSGSGNQYLSFSWIGPTNRSLGSLNAWQTITTGGSTIMVFSAAAASIDENGGAYTVQVTRTSGDDASSVQIELSGSADGSDYSISTTNISFGASVLSVDVVITITDDAAQEGYENIILTLVNPVGGTLGAPAAFTLTINANDAPPLGEPAVWINEINYDSDGTDSNEFVEVAGPQGTDLSTYILLRYEGGGSGLVDGSIALSGSIDDEGCGYGAVDFAFVGLENGPDGIALADTAGGVTSLVQFLSYEGSFVATEGPAVGYTSENVGTQTGTGPTLQLGGDATNYSAFVWETNTISQGSLNINQSITGCTPIPQTNVSFTASAASVDEPGSYDITVTKSLAEGNVSGEISLSGSAVEGVDYTVSTNFTLNGATTSATITVTVSDDLEQEAAETVILTLANVVGGTVVAPSVFTLTINGNDYGPSSIVISQYTETDVGTIPKGIEIWNVSGGDITFDEGANKLDILTGMNGAVLSVAKSVTNGTLAANGVWVIGTTNMNPDVVQAFTFNGDDSLGINLGGIPQDVFGESGVLPAGGAWTSNGVSTANQNIQLKSGITDGDKNGWIDPSERFEYVAIGSDQTGFGIAPGAAPSTNVKFTASAAAVAENVGTYDVTIIKTLAEGTVTGTIELGGTASEGGAADYTVSSTNFTMDGATTSATITVTVNDDAIQEGAETIILTLANVTGGTVVTPSVFTLTINANDEPPEGILSFRFTEAPFLQVSTKDANLTVTDMIVTNPVGTIATDVVTGDYFPNEPYIEESGGWSAESQALAKYFHFSFQPQAGYQVAVTAIAFRAYATTAGPSVFGFDVRDGTSTYETNAPDSILVEVMQPVTGIIGETASINVMIQGWTNDSRVTSGTGAFRLDDVVIYGSVTPTGAVSVEPTFTGVTLSSGQLVFVFSNEVAATYTLQRSVDLTAEPAFTNYTTGITGGSYTQNVVNDGPMSAYRMLKE